MVTRVARLTSPVRSGTDMQPSRPFSFFDDATDAALTSTISPWQVRVFGCLLTSTQNAWAATPTC
jgi:hypothetical protein